MGDETRYYAHSTERSDRSDWQPLSAHLQCVAALAKCRAEKFRAGEWGKAAGLLHDLGKYSKKFQARLEGGARVDHSTAGAIEAGGRYDRLARPLQYVVAGHHAGLANADRGADGRISPLLDRLSASVESYTAHQDEIALPATLPRPPLAAHKGRHGFQGAFFTRMLFSCLVDADYLDTEAFYDRIDGRPSRRHAPPPLADLKPNLDAHLANLAARASASDVNRWRAEILTACREAAKEPPGLFTLTVPTGGGKTLASLAFALDHALAYGLQRVIYVIPYTSIIEQNASVFREALGDDAVLEHHSAFIDDPKAKPDAQDKLHLAMESWDAAIVVTTAVQFFESLFANRPARCRKLHNIAKSVVILDEAQTLPLLLLNPCVAAIDELARNYGATIVLCTATQPALLEDDDSTKSFKGGLRDVREIAPEPKALYQRFRRVIVHRPDEALDDGALVARLRGHHQGLCIVDTRSHACELFERLDGEEGVYHLSALMCPRHRSERLAEIRAALAGSRRCLVVSTSLVEAGVDVDFPVVYRAEAGIDSIAQAAGRCNREGRLGRDGEVFVFRSANRPLRGERQRRALAARDIFRRHDDPLALDAVEAYFREIYWGASTGNEDGLDQRGILRRLEKRGRELLFPFEAIANDFKLIVSEMLPVLIPFDDDSRKLLAELNYSERVGRIARALQPYVVQLHPTQFTRLRAAEAVQPIQPDRFGEQFCVLTNEDLYRHDVGLTWDDPTFRSVEGGIV